MLISVGVNPAAVEYVNIPKIKNRNDMLAAGEIDAATLPQPFFTLSEKAGAQALIDDSVLDYVPEAISFLTVTLEEKGDQVRAFLQAYERALAAINARETREEGVAWLGEEIRASLRTRVRAVGDDRVLGFMRALGEAGIWPSMTAARVPTRGEFANVQSWALNAGLIADVSAYDEVIDGSYLPELVEDDMSEEDEE